LGADGGQREEAGVGREAFVFVWEWWVFIILGGYFDVGVARL
jgi:hypothetical protein